MVITCEVCVNTKRGFKVLHLLFMHNSNFYSDQTSSSPWVLPHRLPEVGAIQHRCFQTAKMPTYRSITISITSQFDICQLPEYAPATSTDDPFSTSPALLNPEQALVTVYIPTYPSSQFWLRYSIAPPYPPKAIYYFKLYRTYFRAPYCCFRAVFAA